MTPRMLVQERARLVERAREYRQPPMQLRRRGQVCVVEGHGLRLAVERGQLIVTDGAGRGRRVRRYSRAGHGLARVVVLGSTGSVTLEALRWLADLGIPFLHLDRDGRLLTHSAAVQLDDARLRRAQALAFTSPAGLAIARTLLTAKLQGQRALLERLPAGVDVRADFDNAASQLEVAATVDELIAAEREAALAYWTAWRPVHVRFRGSDTPAVPEHWLRFGQRQSPLTKSPRLAINPANALLNYLYALLEAETRIGCLAAGLDPGLAIVHADVRARPSLALDVMEAVRPQVDAYVLELLTRRVFRKSDFHETGKGNCRILAPLSHELAATTTDWGRLLAPVVEQVARQLADAPEARIDRIPTPLTGGNRKATRTRRPSAIRSATHAHPKPTPTCHRCGGTVPAPSRMYCDACLPHYQREQYAHAFHGKGMEAIQRRREQGMDPAHGGIAQERRAKRNVQRKDEIRAWEAQYGKVMDTSAFAWEILPRIQGIPLSRLMHATGLSLRYVSQIRRGEKTPHPRHWEALAKTSALP